MNPSKARVLAYGLGGVGLVLAVLAFLIDQDDRGSATLDEAYTTPPGTIAAGVVGLVLILLALAILVIGAGVSLGGSNHATGRGPSVSEELQRLEDLRTAGTITDAEFEKLKSDLISGGSF